MKRYLCLFLFLSHSLFAIVEYSQGIFFDDITPPLYPFNFSGSYLAVTPADFRTPSVEGQSLRFTQTTAAFAYTQPLCEHFGFLFTTGYVGTEIDWKQNPAFTETDFHYVAFNGGFYSTAFPGWDWSATISIFVDTAEFNFGDYALYQGILWGNYAFRPWMSLSAGFVLELGLNKERIWPILGFRFDPCDRWRIHAVYPIDVSIEWDMTRVFTIASSLSFLRNRHRVADTEPMPKAIFEYHTWGAEMDLIYNPTCWLYAKGFAGATFSGDLKITNRNNKHGTHYKFDASPYIGVSGYINY